MATDVLDALKSACQIEHGLVAAQELRSGLSGANLQPCGRKSERAAKYVCHFSFQIRSQGQNQNLSLDSFRARCSVQAVTDGFDGFAVRHISSVASTCLVRVLRCHCAQLLAVLPAVRSLRHEAVTLTLLRVTGSARVAREVATREHSERAAAMTEGLPRKVHFPQVSLSSVCMLSTRARAAM